MTHASRIRLFLILAALLPAILILWFLVATQDSVREKNARLEADSGLRQYVAFESKQIQHLSITIKQVAASKELRQSIVRLRSGKSSGRRFSIDALGIGQIDFAEILDSSGLILSSWSRPGLVGHKRRPLLLPGESDREATGQSVEYDMAGAHAALYAVRSIQPGYYLAAGIFLDNRYITLAEYACDCEIELSLSDDSLTIGSNISRMQLQTIYDLDGSYRSILTGGREAGFYMVATFSLSPLPDNAESLIPVAALVALAGVIIALGLGFYITGRTRREIDNLVHAFSRVAKGDFATPVMAYEEGEFSELADSFSEMMRQLSDSQSRLASTEKIAAWQVMGRKVAHEIKNPLTPISIAVDDIRRSYDEQLPNFADTLHQNTDMIKTEIRRLTTLLDQFVRFARMTPPTLSTVAIDRLVANICQLYQSDIENGRVIIQNQCGSIRKRIDQDQMTQVLLNLIKNGLESADNSRVTVRLFETTEGWTITVEDTGPGFDSEFLANRFEPYISSKKNGSGLGLVICQRIVVDHGGVIELANDTDHGARVTIRFTEVKK